MSVKEKLTVGRVLAAVASIGAAAAVMFWGVPWYLKGQVHELFMAELAEQRALAPENVSPVQNAATINAIQTQLTGIENRMIARDELFYEFLQRQQELAEARAAND